MGSPRFDGTALYEHLDPREGFHPDWNTLIYNFGPAGECGISSSPTRSTGWREHPCGRTQGRRSCIPCSTRDYSRREGEWIPNRYGGRENLEAIAFLKELNERVYATHPGIQTMAEESTAWPGVSRPTSAGGLGFGFKWNMGWMHDTLEYMSREPVHRRHNHHQMTFASTYAFSENFILPLSHDEVVHGKGSLLDKMPGDGSEKFANLRAYLAFMWAHPGKKLLFMGGEFAQGREWRHDDSLDWYLLDIGYHRGVQQLVRDLNHIYRDVPAFHRRDCEPGGLEWIEADAAEESVYVFARHGGTRDSPAIAVCNFTPLERARWRIGLPLPGTWRIALNTGDRRYGGDNGNEQEVLTGEPRPWQGMNQSATLDLPGLSALILVHEP